MRPLIIITVGYIIGIIWGLYLKISIAPIIFLFGGISLIFYKKNIKSKKIISKSFVFYLIISAILAIISNWQIIYLENKFENLYKGKEEVNVIGTIISDREENTYQAKYTIKIDSVNGDTKYNDTNLLLYVQKEENLEYGDKIHILGTYDEAKCATNYKLFDYKEYLKEKNVYGIVKADKVQVIEKDNLNNIFILLNNLREKIKINLKEIIGEEANVTIGILLRRYS